MLSTKTGTGPCPSVWRTCRVALTALQTLAAKLKQSNSDEAAAKGHAIALPRGRASGSTRAISRLNITSRRMAPTDLRLANHCGLNRVRWRLASCLLFDPTDPHSARFNPLLEVRKGSHEVRDVLGNRARHQR